MRWHTSPVAAFRETWLRVLPPGVGARIETDSWQRGAVYDWISEKGVQAKRSSDVSSTSESATAPSFPKPTSVATIFVIGAAGGGRRRGAVHWIGVLVSGSGQQPAKL